MPSAGELLRSERMKRNRNLTEIAAETRISRRYLEAIEADNISDLPGDFFYKAFIRQYARVLGLDDRTTQQILGSAVPIAEPDPVPALNLVYEKAHSGDSVRWSPSTGVAIGVLVAVLAGGSALYALWQRMQAPAEGSANEAVQQTASSPQQQVETPAAEPPSAATSVATVATPPADTAPPPVSTPQPVMEPSAAPAGQVAVELTAAEPAWIQLSSDGKTVYVGTLQANETKSVAIGSTGRLLTGNAGAVDVRINGKPIGSIGPKGQVRTVLFNGGAFEVISPKPKAPQQDDEQLFSRPSSPAPAP